jgi:hypothetical protein
VNATTLSNLFRELAVQLAANGQTESNIQSVHMVNVTSGGTTSQTVVIVQTTTSGQ